LTYARERFGPTSEAFVHANTRVFRKLLTTDNTKKTGLHRQLISLEEDDEVRDWTTSLGRSQDELHAAVKAVGNSAEKVRESLSKKN
jgi:hypothetical protein